jgi:hypothetical protein
VDPGHGDGSSARRRRREADRGRVRQSRQASGGLTLNSDRTERILKRTATDTPCTAQEPFPYPDPCLGPEFDATCVGTPAFNGFSGEGIVNATRAVGADD